MTRHQHGEQVNNQQENSRAIIRQDADAVFTGYDQSSPVALGFYITHGDLVKVLLAVASRPVYEYHQQNADQTRPVCTKHART